MSDRRVFRLVHSEARRRVLACVAEAPEGWHVEVKPPTRSLDQNARLWVCLTEISRQVDWYGQRLTTDEWKDVFSAALKKQKVVPGLDGGFVVCGQRTSQMSVRDMSEMLELMNAFAAERGVEFAESAAEATA